MTACPLQTMSPKINCMIEVTLMAGLEAVFVEDLKDSTSLPSILAYCPS